MRKLFSLMIIIVLVYFARPLWEEPVGDYVDLSFLDPVDNAIDSFIGRADVTTALDEAKEFTARFASQLQALVLTDADSMPEAVGKPELSETDSLFAIHNVTLGMSKEEAQVKVGLPLRLMKNEYGTDWHSYHTDYQNYVLLAYDQNGAVNGMFTNQDIISSTEASR